ncbi:MAG TPA: hypothetical protein VGO62_05275 [Myxococcota bacterium]
MLDVVLVAVLVAAALAFLAWNLSGRGPKPACHVTGAPVSSAGAPDVIIGASLARGLERAARNRSSN